MIEKLFAAKSGAESWKWLPLWMHLEDTVGVMEYLLESYVSGSFSNSCGLSLNETKKVAKFIAYTHDIGKATPAFQYKIAYNVGDRVRFLEKYGLKMPASLTKSDCTPHTIAGEEILTYFGCCKSVAGIIGAHHGIPTELKDVKNQNLNDRLSSQVQQN